MSTPDISFESHVEDEHHRVISDTRTLDFVNRSKRIREYDTLFVKRMRLYTIVFRGSLTK